MADDELNRLILDSSPIAAGRKPRETPWAGTGPAVPVLNPDIGQGWSQVLKNLPDYMASKVPPQYPEPELDAGPQPQNAMGAGLLAPFVENKLRDLYESGSAHRRVMTGELDPMSPEGQTQALKAAFGMALAGRSPVPSRAAPHVRPHPEPSPEMLDEIFKQVNPGIDVGAKAVAPVPSYYSGWPNDFPTFKKQIMDLSNDIGEGKISPKKGLQRDKELVSYYDVHDEPSPAMTFEGKPFIVHEELGPFVHDDPFVKAMAGAAEKPRKSKRLIAEEDLHGPAPPVDESLPMDPASVAARRMEHWPLGPFYSGVGTHDPAISVYGFRDPRVGKGEKAIFASPSEHIATEYYAGGGEGPVFKLAGRSENPRVVNWKDVAGEPDYSSYDMKKLIDDSIQKGHDYIHIKDMFDVGGKQDQHLFLDPNLLRSFGARFDPRYKEAAGLMLGLGGAAVAAPTMLDEIMRGDRR